ENALLRRELTRLASQILTVARAQGPVPVAQQRLAVTQVYTEITALDEPQEPEPIRHEAHATHAGNGVARDPELTEAAPEVDAMAAAMSAPEATEEPPPNEQAGEADAAEPKGPLAKRFAARREKRRARKSGSGAKSASLSDRLKGLVADRAES